ncbi:hypothetical protein EYB53_002295 [Candidatus Chloroploca sp. M-50]|uniref:Uncharacterized protein n=1 Tax=Candidatus Chloroploca mongolica TaxID=2528176 RepID=A0ABS4D523_9CHLR|nr:hypothetical protein [Candidatus Chloroploca mongolica]MBP1464530.1 hypothetical protein [Candidatus Chloroploca mongolica]
MRKALDSATPAAYTRTVPYAAPTLGPFKAGLAELLAEREQITQITQMRKP